jgi:hemoglobin
MDNALHSKHQTLTKPDISNHDDIVLLVDTFYSRVREDALLGPIFEAVIQDQWPEHLEKLYTFWESILLGSQTYTGRPFPPHAKLPINEEHFARWLRLFRENLKQWEGPIANEASNRAGMMATLFLHKLDHLRDRESKPIQ